MVELLLAKEGIGVRFPLAAPQKTSSKDDVFCLRLLSEPITIKLISK